MKFKIVDRGTEVDVRYVSYAREWFLCFPMWTILGGTSTEEKAENLCQEYRNTKNPQPEKVREIIIP